MKNTENTRNIGTDAAEKSFTDAYLVSATTARTIDNIRRVNQVVEDTLIMMADEYGEEAAEREIEPIQKAAAELIHELFKYSNSNTLMLLSFKDNTRSEIVMI